MIDEIEEEWDDLSLGQRKQLEPVKDAIEYTETTLEGDQFFDPFHAMALRENVKSKPLDRIFEELENERRNPRSRKTSSRSLMNYLKDVVDNARMYVDAMEIVDEYLEVEDKFMRTVTDVTGNVADEEELEGPVAEKAKETANTIEGPVTDHLPDEPTEFGYQLLELFQEEYRFIREEYVAQVSRPERKNHRPSPNPAETSSGNSEEPVPANPSPSFDWDVLGYEPSSAEKNLYRALVELEEVEVSDVRSAFYWSWVDLNDAEAESSVYPGRDDRSRLKDVKKGFDGLLSEGLVEGKGAGNRSELDQILKTAQYIENNGYTQP